MPHTKIFKYFIDYPDFGTHLLVFQNRGFTVYGKYGTKIFKKPKPLIYIFDIVLGAVMGTLQSPKLVRLHFGYLIGPNVAAWNDFRHTKNQMGRPIIRIQLTQGRNNAQRVNRAPKLSRLLMGLLTGSITAP